MHTITQLNLGSRTRSPHLMHKWQPHQDVPGWQVAYHNNLKILVSEDHSRISVGHDRPTGEQDRMDILKDSSIKYRGRFLEDVSEIPQDYVIALAALFCDLFDVTQVESQTDIGVRKSSMSAQTHETPELVFDLDTGELIRHDYHGSLVAQRKSDGYVNATAMCKAEGKRFHNYSQLSSTQEFLTHLESITGIPAVGLVISKPGGIEANGGTWVHPKVAIDLAMWLSVEFKSWAIDHLLNWMQNTPASDMMTFHQPKTMVEALERWLSAEKDKERLVLKNTVVSQRLTHAENMMAREEKAILLTDWISNTSASHGHGPNIGRKMLRCLGILKRQNVKGCRHAEEDRICQTAIDSGMLFYSAYRTVNKTKKLGDEVVPIVDASGEQVVGASRCVLVDADTGTDQLSKIFMDRPEFMLRRLVHHKTCNHIRRLAGRYSFMAHDTNSLAELTPVEREQCVMIHGGDGEWSVTCTVTASEQLRYTAVGYGRTLQDAYADLAANYLKSR